jgi:hypothetical protein
VEPRYHASEPISPELALVDPELGARARAALPDRPWPAPVPFQPPPRGAPRRRFPVVSALGTVVLAAIFAILGLSMIPIGDRPTLASEGEQRSAAPGRPPNAVQPQSGGVKAARQAVAPLHGPRTRPQTRPQPAGSRRPRAKTKVQKPRQAQKAARRAVAPQFTPTRLFSWPPRAGAAYYTVAFARNGKSLYRTQTRKAWLRLPRSIRFTPGTYGWIVRPAIRDDALVRLGAPIVDSTFRVGRD